MGRAMRAPYSETEAESMLDSPVSAARKSRSHPLTPCRAAPSGARAEPAMNHDTPASRWSTASFGHTAAASPLELSALGDHLQVCQQTHGRLLSLRCAAETAHGFIAARFVTTLLVVAILIGVASLLA